MQRTTQILIWMLALVVGCTLISAAFVTWVPEGYVNLGSYQPRWEFLSTITVSSGVLIAILTFSRERRKIEVEQCRNRSRIFLERASLGFDSAAQLLSTRRNDRIVWIRAARTLLCAIRMRDQIEDPDYRYAYDLEAERTRNGLYDSLTIEDTETGERSPLPPQFFYGIPDWRECKSLDEAAIRASGSVEAYGVSIDEIAPQPTLKPIAVKSVIAIYNFIDYPKDYDDPLQHEDDWNDHWGDSFGVNQGARRYVAHTKSKMAFGGKLHNR